MSPAAKTSKQTRAYLLTGDDDFSKQRKLEALLAELIDPDFADFDLERMEGDTAAADRIMAGLGIPPFSSPRRVVLVKYANRMDESEQKKLASLLPQTPNAGCLILVTPAAEIKDGKPRKGSEVVADVSRVIRKIGEVIKTGQEKGAAKTTAARQFAQSLFSDAGKKIDPRALSDFLQRVGSDHLLLASEAAKLINYAGDSTAIKPSDVAFVTSETPEEKVFKMVDAVGAHKPAEAMRYLNELFDAGDQSAADAPKVLANLARTFRLMWQYKMLSGRGVRNFNKGSVPAELQALLPSNPNLLDVLSRQAWQERRIHSSASRLSQEQLIRGFDAIARADAMLKGIEGGIQEPRMIMELLVLELAK